MQHCLQEHDLNASFVQKSTLTPLLKWQRVAIALHVNR
jgi:hypothetical protein